MNEHRLHEILDERPSLRRRCGVPHSVDVERPQERGDFLEPRAEFGPLLDLGICSCTLTADCVDLRSESGFLISECLGADSIGVVKIERPFTVAAWSHMRAKLETGETRCTEHRAV